MQNFCQRVLIRKLPFLMVGAIITSNTRVTSTNYSKDCPKENQHISCNSQNSIFHNTPRQQHENHAPDVRPVTATKPKTNQTRAPFLPFLAECYNNSPLFCIFMVSQNTRRHTVLAILYRMWYGVPFSRDRTTMAAILGAAWNRSRER